MDKIPFQLEQSLIDNPPKIFGDVLYVPEGTVDLKITKLLENGGAKLSNYMGITSTHMITGDGADDAKIAEAIEVFDKPVVDQRWVAFSARAGKLLPTEGFNSSSKRLFSGFRVSSSRIKGNDLTILWANVTYYGGHFQDCLTTTTTHLITNEIGSKKFEKASENGVKIVCCDWVSDCIKANAIVDEGKYHPKLVQDGATVGIHAEATTEIAQDAVKAIPSPKAQFRAKLLNPPMKLPVIQQVNRMNSSPRGLQRTSVVLRQQLTLSEQATRVPLMRAQHLTKAALVVNTPQKEIKAAPPLLPITIQHTVEERSPHYWLSAAKSPQQSLQIKPPTPLPYDNRQQGVTLPSPSVPYAVRQHLQHKSPPSASCQQLPKEPQASGQPLAQLALPTNWPEKAEQPTSSLEGHQSCIQQQKQIQGQEHISPGIPMPIQSQIIVQRVGAAQVGALGPAGLHGKNRTEIEMEIYRHIQTNPVDKARWTRMNKQNRQRFLQKIYQRYVEQQSAKAMICQQQINQGQQLPDLKIVEITSEQITLLPKPQTNVLRQGALQAPDAHSSKFPPYSCALRLQTKDPSKPDIPGLPQYPAENTGISVSTNEVYAPDIGQQPCQPQQRMVIDHIVTVQGKHPQEDVSTVSRGQQVGAPLMAAIVQVSLPSPGGQPIPRQQQQRLRSPTTTAAHQVSKIMNVPNGCHVNLCTNTVSVPGRQTPSTMKSSFYGFEVDFKPPTNCFLIGCTFWAAQVLNEPNWRRVATFYGGEVLNEYNASKVTHVLCNNENFPEFPQVLRDKKRLVTLHWLSDTCTRKIMAPPFLAMHLPTHFDQENLPLKDLAFSLTGFDGHERERVIKMLVILGAVCTPYLTKHSKGLVARRQDGKKFTKAREWNIPVVSVQFLNELLLRKDRQWSQMVHRPVYQNFTLDQPFQFDTDIARHLMVAWETPIRANVANVEQFKSRKRPLDNADENAEPVKRAKLEDDEKEQLSIICDFDSGIADTFVMEIKPDSSNKRPPVIVFSGFRPNFKALATKMIVRLGGIVTDDLKEATHMVCWRIVTWKLYGALCKMDFIVGATWLRDSFKANRFIDESKYVPGIVEFENHHGVSIADVLNKPNRSLLFKGIKFYITPGLLRTEKHGLDTIIECGGGVIDTTSKSMTEVRAKARQNPRKYIVIVSMPDFAHFKEFFYHTATKQLSIFTRIFLYKSIAEQKVDLGLSPVHKG